MSDFFADLEAQLVAAHPRRRRARALAAAPALALVLVAVGAAGVGIAIGGSRDTEPASTAASRSPIAVLNATVTPGAGRAVAERLGRAGYTIGVVTDAATQGDLVRTEVLYRRGAEDVARAVAQQLHARPLALTAFWAHVYGVPASADVAVVVGGPTRVGDRRLWTSLTAPAGGASGRMRLMSGRDGTELSFQADGLDPKPLYAVWLVVARQSPRLLTLVPPATTDGRLRIRAPLPPPGIRAGDRAHVLLTRERSLHPTRPGPTVLAGLL